MKVLAIRVESREGKTSPPLPVEGSFLAALFFAFLPKKAPKEFRGEPRFFRGFPTFFQDFSEGGKARGKAFFALFLLVTLWCGFGREAPSADARQNLIVSLIQKCMKKVTTQIGFAQTVKSSVTTCTINQLYAAMDAAITNDVCAEISDALEQVKRGEMSREDFETYKRDKKKELMVLTPQ